MQTLQEITKSWKYDTHLPLVSIVCVTYNHKNFIEDAIKSFLNQKTKFMFEILIFDDASTDGTIDIIKKYQLEYPELIIPIYQEENQYSKDPTFHWDLFTSNAKGKYIAFCDGDDYWLDPLKIQKQINLLEVNPSYNLCFHSAKKITDNKDSEIIGQYDTQNSFVPFPKILLRSRGMIPTASCVITQKSVLKIQKFMQENKFLKQGDIYLQYISAYKNGALYINEPMSVYRYMTDGSWTQRHNSSEMFRIGILMDKLKSYSALELFFSHMHQETFTYLYLNSIFRLCICLSESNSINAPKLEQICKNLILDVINKNHLENKCIDLYGASSTTKWVIENFKKFLTIENIIDSDITKENLDFEGYMIKHPSHRSNNRVFITLFGLEELVEEDLIQNYKFTQSQCLYVKHIPFNLLDTAIQEIDSQMNKTLNNN